MNSATYLSKILQEGTLVATPVSGALNRLQLSACPDAPVEPYSNYEV